MRALTASAWTCHRPGSITAVIVLAVLVATLVHHLTAAEPLKVAALPVT
jgi:hypothetical protein